MLLQDLFYSQSWMESSLQESLILNQLKAESDNSLAVLKDKTIASSILHETFVKLTPDRLEEIIALQEITFAKLKDEGTEKFLYKKVRKNMKRC